MIIDDVLPRFLGRVGPRKKIEVLIVDDTLVGKFLKINDRIPILASIKHNWHRLHSMGLSQRKGFKHLVESPIPTWKKNYSSGSQNKMKFSYRKIAKLKAELRRNERIWILLVRQLDI